MEKLFRSVDLFEIGESKDTMVIRGKAVSFDSPTVLYEVDGLKYYEVISRGAFDGCDMKDACLKYNHDDSTPILARIRGGSLSLNLMDDGLYFDATLFNTSFSRDCYELVRQGALQCSFAFTVTTDGDVYDRNTRTRRINKIGRLYDLSIVSLPAYSDTFVQARSFFEAEAERDRMEMRNVLDLAKAKYFYFGGTNGN